MNHVRIPSNRRAKQPTFFILFPCRFEMNFVYGFSLQIFHHIYNESTLYWQQKSTHYNHSEIWNGCSCRLSIYNIYIYHIYISFTCYSTNQRTGWMKVRAVSIKNRSMIHIDWFPDWLRIYWRSFSLESNE